MENSNGRHIVISKRWGFISVCLVFYLISSPQLISFANESQGIGTQLIYSEDFSDGPGGWHFYKEHPYIPFKGMLQRPVEWKREWGYIESKSPWWVDASHKMPGEGFLQLIAWIWMDSYKGGLTKSSIDMTEAYLNFKIMVKDLDLKRGHLYFWLQQEYEHGFLHGGLKRANYALTEFPIDMLITPNTWNEITLPLRSSSSEWTCLGSSYESQNGYGCVPVQEALSNVNCNFGFIILPVDPNNPAYGIIRFDDIRIYKDEPLSQDIPSANGGEYKNKSTTINTKDKIGYSIGMDIGKHLKQIPLGINTDSLTKGIKDGLMDSYSIGKKIGEYLSNMPFDINPDTLTRGVKDVLSNSETLLSEYDARKMIPAILLNRKDRENQTAKIEFEKKAGEKVKKKGELFLSINKENEGVKTLPSGLQYKVIKAGVGKKPKLNDTVVVHYRGTLIDGTEFGNSYRTGISERFPISEVIIGLGEALQLMEEASKWQLFIPPDLAYGEYTPEAKIGPYATLILEIELISIEEKK